MTTNDALTGRERWEDGQRGLWGQRPHDWAELAEPQNTGLIDAALDAADVRPGTDLLDVGCGSGLALQHAAARGATVSGIDIAASLLAIAGERVPGADLRLGGLDSLPFADAAFDVVLAVNALAFAFDPHAALTEIARTLRPGGRLAIAQFSAPERCESTALHLAMETVVPVEAHADHAPYALAAPGALEETLAGAGLDIASDRELAGDWHYADEEAALRGLTCSGGGTRAIRLAGEDPVRAILVDALVPFRQSDGSFLMHNHFRLLIARRPGSR
jgi:SAM-dependent methyltransferase